MTAFAGGQVMCGGEGRVHVHIWGEPYYICPEDLGMLLFVGERVSLFKKGPAPQEVPQVSGSVYLSPSGRAVIIAPAGTATCSPATNSSRLLSVRTCPAFSLKCQSDDNIDGDYLSVQGWCSVTASHASHHLKESGKYP